MMIQKIKVMLEYGMVRYTFHHYIAPQGLYKCKLEALNMCWKELICTAPGDALSSILDFSDVMKKLGFTFKLDPQICLLENFITINAHLRNFQKNF